MAEAKFCRMEHLTLRREREQLVGRGTAVRGVANYRMPNRLQMDTDLMGTPCFDLAADERDTLKPLYDAPVCACMLPVTGDNRHLFTVDRVSSD
jgi:hypothetical protein